MRTAFDPADFGIWEARQPIRFGLREGCPHRLPDDERVTSRVARVIQIACRVLDSRNAAATWMTDPDVRLGGSTPEAVAGGSEEGCQVVLRALATMSKHRLTSGG